MSFFLIAGASFTTGSIAINIILGLSLKLLWGLINVLQFIVFCTDWNVMMPPNADIATKTFRIIALGKFIPYDWLTEPLSKPFNEPESDESESEISKRGNVISNMGVILLFGSGILVLAVTVLLASRTCCKSGTKCHSLAVKLKQKIFWNSILRFALQSYLKNIMAVVFSLYGSNFSSMNSAISLTLFIILVALPFLFAYTLHKNRDKLTDEEVR